MRAIRIIFITIIAIILFFTLAVTIDDSTEYSDCLGTLMTLEQCRNHYQHTNQ